MLTNSSMRLVTVAVVVAAAALVGVAQQSSVPVNWAPPMSSNESSSLTTFITGLPGHHEGLKQATRVFGVVMASIAIAVSLTVVSASALIIAGIISEPVRAALWDTLLYWRVLRYFASGGSYKDCPFLKDNTRVKVYLHSLALIFFLWDKPHYRSGTFQNDMTKNLRNVAFPGTGVPLDWLCRSRLIFAAFLFFGMPLMFCVYAVILARERTVRGVCKTYQELLLTPEPWFAYWRLNCRLASYHALLTGCSDYKLEDKWSFLVAAEEKDIPVSPFLKVDSIVCKDRNEEGGMGIHFFKNALHGGQWIIQHALNNSPLLQEWLPDDAPLSTLRVITASRNALDVIDGAMEEGLEARKEKVSSLSCVFRAGRAGASTDHSSVLFDTDVSTGDINAGTTNAHWYQLGVHDKLLRYRPAATYTQHPDNGVELTGKQVPDMAEICELVETAHATLLPGVPLCGWDVALTKEADRCLLEVNLSCNFFNGTFDKPAYFQLLDDFFSRLDAKRHASRHASDK